VLPILHLNGYKIANPTVLARIPQRTGSLFRRLRLQAVFRRRRRPHETMHQLHGGARSTPRWPSIRASSAGPREGFTKTRPRWPMIILRSPKGWTGPKVVDGKPSEGTGVRIRCRSAT
jgi:xylulose-5-phosphate/fructose-6-phosphate phosphoketolase